MSPERKGNDPSQEATDDQEARPPQPHPTPEPDEGEEEGGSIQISENVIAAVVRKYTLEVAGVVRFATGSVVGGLAEMIGRRSHESSVVVDIEGEVVNITVTLVLEFGVKVPEVAELVQNVIRTRVSELTGKHVNRVNVIVRDLEDKEAAEQRAAEASEERSSAEA